MRKLVLWFLSNINSSRTPCEKNVKTAQGRNLALRFPRRSISEICSVETLIWIRLGFYPRQRHITSSGTRGFWEHTCWQEIIGFQKVATRNHQGLGLEMLVLFLSSFCGMFRHGWCMSWDGKILHSHTIFIQLSPVQFINVTALQSALIFVGEARKFAGFLSRQTACSPTNVGAVKGMSGWALGRN